MPVAGNPEYGILGYSLAFAPGYGLISGDPASSTVSFVATSAGFAYGVDGTGSDVTFYGDTAGVYAMWDYSADSFLYTDNAKCVFGTGGDLTFVHNGTNSLVTSTTGNLVIDNTSVTGATFLDVGTDTAATKVAFRNNSGTEILTVTGAGVTNATGLRIVTTGATAITTTRSLGANDSGGVFTVAQSSAYQITLPTPAGAGQRYVLQLVSPGAFNVTVVATGCTFEGTIVNDTTSVLPATGSTFTFVSGTAALGDNIEFISTSSSKYFARAISSTAGGITIT